MKRCMVIIVFIAAAVVMGGATSLDDFDRTFRDAERSLRMPTLPKTQQLDMRKYEIKDLPKEDRTAKENEELLRQYLEKRDRNIRQEMRESWDDFLKQYGIIIEVSVAAICIAFLSFFFYQQKIKQLAAKGTRQDSQKAYRHPGYRG